MDFWPKNTLRPYVKWLFPVIPAGTRSVVIVGHILMALTVPLSFVDHGPKLRVLTIAIGEWPKMAKKRVEPRKMTHTSEQIHKLQPCDANLT